MVLVSVRQYDAPDLGCVLLHKGKVGDHQIDAQHIGVREHQPRSHDKHILPALIEGHVFADLIESAQRHNAHRRPSDRPPCRRAFGVADIFGVHLHCGRSRFLRCGLCAFRACRPALGLLRCTQRCFFIFCCAVVRLIKLFFCFGACFGTRRRFPGRRGLLCLAAVRFLLRRCFFAAHGFRPAGLF